MATTLGVSHLTTFCAGEKVSPAPHEPKLIGHARRPEYMFIHTVRFWCMLAIVFMHCAYEPLPLHQVALLVQPFKFGTIGFFLISGFLLGDRLPASDPFGYLRRRMHRLVPAWLFWCGLETAYLTCKDLAHTGHANISTHVLIATAWAEAAHCLTHTALWFVPNFIVALTCVVLCRRWLNDLRLGAIFLAANLFYSVNVYTCWLPSRHTEAVFGFVFYLWLGAWCALRKEQLQRWADSLSMARLLTCIVLAVGGSLVEAQLIAEHHRLDPLNSLRFCNQLYSVLMVLVLIRIKRATWPRSVNVAATTYGIYLTHSMVIALVFAVATPLVFRPGHTLGYAGMVAVWAILAPAAYLISLSLTKLFASSPWPWMIGAPTEAPTRIAAQLPGSLQSAAGAN